MHPAAARPLLLLFVGNFVGRTWLAGDFTGSRALRRQTCPSTRRPPAHPECYVLCASPGRVRAADYAAAACAGLAGGFSIAPHSKKSQKARSEDATSSGARLTCVSFVGPQSGEQQPAGGVGRPRRGRGGRHR
jgi:hypothetical protein